MTEIFRLKQSLLIPQVPLPLVAIHSQFASHQAREAVRY